MTHKTFATYLLILSTLLLSGNTFSSCEATKWFEYRGIKLWKFSNSNAYFYITSNMAIDADGAPNAYHPEDKGIDALSNAGFPNGGWKSILVSDPTNNSTPYIQPNGEYAGYFVSMTTLQDKTLPKTDIHRYIDSRNIPYMVFPGKFYSTKGTGTFGDLAISRNLSNNKETPVIVADAGPTNAELGEVSIRLAENLGGNNVNPRNGAGMPQGKFVYAVFPKSKAEPAWPLSADQMTNRTNELLAELGGWEKILACVNTN